MQMNDVNVAAENEESKEARDFVELGDVSKETKGGGGHYFDGVPGGLWA
jgi:hypothetical protein